MCEGRSEAQDPVEELQEAVLSLAATSGAQTDEVQEWLENSQIVRASRTPDFHANYSNLYQLRSREPLEFATSFQVQNGNGYGGVNRDPWLAPGRGSSTRDLNIAEVNSLAREAARMGFEIQIYSGGAIVPTVLPFPVQPREGLFPVDYQAFSVLCARAGEDSRRFFVHYRRRFVMGIRHASSGVSGGQPVMAFGYSPVGSNLLFVTYTLA
jgi:hypothetical protein